MTAYPCIKLDGQRRVIHLTDERGVPTVRIVPLTRSSVKPFLLWNKLQPLRKYIK